MDGMNVAEIVSPGMTKAEERRRKKEERRRAEISTMLEGAKRYAASDRSDPWTYARCVAHIKSGVASIYNAHEQKGYYDADPYQAKREYSTENGVIEYYVVDHRNVVRP
jgi:hypothetical protein